MKTGYNFASPANRRATGPLNRLIKLVESPRYAPMIDHVEARIESLERTGNQAQQRVTLTGSDGQTVTYRFERSVCRAEPLEECWLTDSALD
ncbi:DUF4864 domain-containing protein [Halorubrum sp. SD690R]|uniref:DUF4864 domain-containing protein n=1 Tax=Halorubrum sp. SD690R TaxID=2518117 RepID=UPI001F545107|nr:DUF4864 domain-containing protein [Halorubrum sp. SD690R]